MDQGETWHARRPRPWPHCVRWGPALPPQRGTAPQFSAHSCCGQMAGWIKMPLGMEAEPPNFWPFLLWPTAGCINKPLGTEVGLVPGDIMLDGNPPPLPREGNSSPPFSANVYCGDGRPYQQLLSIGNYCHLYCVILLLVHGQVTTIFVVSVCLFVCLFVCLCRVFLSRLWSNFDQTRTHVICLGLVVSPRI